MAQYKQIWKSFEITISLQPFIWNLDYYRADRWFSFSFGPLRLAIGPFARIRLPDVNQPEGV